MLVGAEQRGEAGVGIEGRPAQPVDRAVAADQRRGLAIADQPVIFDPAGQVDHPLKSCISDGRVAAPRVARLSAATSIAAAISSIASGNRRRQFGCSLTVPGILG